MNIIKSYLKYFIPLCLFRIFLSCESPNEANQIEIDNSPSTNICINDSVIYLGDTLRLTIHVKVESLLNGSIDFGDSSSVVFGNIKTVLDTTLLHIYKRSKSYKVAVSFTDGSKITAKEYNVSVIPNPSFYVILNVNKTFLSMFHDTLKVTLQASDALLYNGSLDFKDGTVVQFTNLNQVFDTTIFHVYQSIGLRRISASFSNGYQTITKEIDIEVNTNPSPGLAWQFNNVDLELGDTLKIWLFAFDPSLLSGSLDFGDGTIISFSRSNFFYASEYFNYRNSYFIDTTITYLYTKPGKHRITTMFNDGTSNTTKQNEVVVKPRSLVTFTLNKTDFILGDTVIVNLHASTGSSLDGTLDFNDGTIMLFSNIKGNFDTTISHIYSQSGEYLLSSVFSDGSVSTTFEKAIKVSRYYELSFKVGMKWLYNYHYSFNSVINGYHKSEAGTVEWKIISTTNNTTYNVRQVRTTTTHEEDMHGFDSTYSIIDTSIFTIAYSYNSIIFNIPFIGSSFTIPNHSYVTYYPIVVQGSSYPTGTIYCRDLVGLYYYHYNFSQKYWNESTQLELFNFTPP